MVEYLSEQGMGVRPSLHLDDGLCHHSLNVA